MIKYKLTIILLHHTKKENNSGKFRIDKKDLLRGSSDFVNIADNILFVEKGVRKLWYSLFQVKCRIAEEFETKSIKLDWSEKDGIRFEEITNLLETDSDVMANQCAIEIVKSVASTEKSVFKLSDIKGEISKKYKKNVIHRAINTLIEQGVTERNEDKKGEYVMNYEHQVFASIEEQEKEVTKQKANKEQPAEQTKL